METLAPQMQSLPPASLAVLLAMKARLLRNGVALALRDHRWRVAVGALVVAILCLALYVLLAATLDWLRGKHLESVLAIDYIFHFFFIAVIAMLWISSGLLSYAALFGQAESAYLLVAPIRAWHIVSVKFVEAFVLSSWSLVLLGLPLLAAMARVYELRAGFIALFAAGFLALALIPSAWGLLSAYLVARWLPRRVLVLLAVAAGLIVAAALWASAWDWLDRGGDYTNWLKAFYSKLQIARAAFLPSTWMSRLTIEAGRGFYAEAAFYLAVLAANAVFFSWLAVRVVARDLQAALMRASEGSARRLRRGGLVTAAMAWAAFFWLPGRMRTMILKDLRTFLRDASQWSQLGVLAALLILYVLNLPRLDVRVLGPYAPVVVPFLNLAAISLILATFTGRFVFPQVSLEAGQLWLVATMPMPRNRIVISKFVSALAVTLATAAVIFGLSVYMLDMAPLQAAVQLLLAGAICVGLCGLAVGMGAWLPCFEERSSARIASGLGGMLNLIASMVWVGLVNSLHALLSRQSLQQKGALSVPLAAAVVLVVWLAAGLLASGTMWAGMRSLRRRDL